MPPFFSLRIIYKAFIPSKENAANNRKALNRCNQVLSFALASQMNCLINKMNTGMETLMHCNLMADN